MAAGQKVEGPILVAVGRLKLVPQAELPFVLQLQSGDCLTQGTAVLTDHTEGGTCEQIQDQKLDSRTCSATLIIKFSCLVLYCETDCIILSC